jgi:hypothetical protein
MPDDHAAQAWIRRTEAERAQDPPIASADR